LKIPVLVLTEVLTGSICRQQWSS